jgi:3-hydroxybutyryl-CoA dehydrogenase
MRAVPPPPSDPVAATIGVVGAGTMGSGIAQLAALTGARTLVHDAVPERLERGVERLRAGLDKGAQRGRWSGEDARAAAQRVEPVGELGALAPCALVIEAIVESLAAKRELLATLAGIVDAGCVLATNTSSLSVTEIAAAVPGPERVVGMHFFNPPPLMRLVEVVAGEASGQAALALARGTGAAMGKRVIAAADGPGFLVNRCGRPFALEALRVVQEGLATPAQVDRICRLGAGFRMGPFELQDLVGIDVGFSVSKSFYEQSFGEPRWRPSPLAGKRAAAGRHGRKTGRGWYDYDHEPPWPPDPDPREIVPPAHGDDDVLVVGGDGVVAGELTDLAEGAGWRALSPEEAAETGEVPFLIVDCGADPVEAPLQGGPRAILCAEGSLSALDPEGGAAGFHAVPPLGAARLVEATRGPNTSLLAFERTEHLFGTLGKHVEWVGDAPGLVLGRIVAQLVNEAAFALRDGVGAAEDIDAGMVLGLNHPRGPLAWGDLMGLDHVLAVLDGLWAEHHDPAYRACPLLRHHVWDGRLGRQTGAGFHAHESLEDG